MKQLFRHIFIFALIAAVLLPQLGCTDSDYRKAARAAAGIASGLAALEDVNEQLFKAGVISKDEASAIAGGVVSATLANDQFVVNIRAAGTINAGNKQLVGAWFSQVFTSLEALNQQGVLRVKNPDAQAKLALAFQAIQASVTVMMTLMSQNGIAVPRTALAAGGGFVHLPSWNATWSSSAAAAPRLAPLFPEISLSSPVDCARFFGAGDPDFHRCKQLARLAPATIGEVR